MSGRASPGLAVGIAATLLASSLGARAESGYPSRPIHIVVPYPAGGIVDIVARTVTEQVGRDLKQAIVVEDRPGANSNIGTAAVARSQPDGNPGTGSSIDLSAQKLFQVAHIKLTNVGYKGQPPALIDLMTTLMHFEIVSLALALPHIRMARRSRSRCSRTSAWVSFRTCRRSRKPDIPKRLTSPGTASTCPRRHQTHWSKKSMTPSTRRCKTPTSSITSRYPTSPASRCR
jgi:tripartite-type tricarboxylate transporter receptor subunit TctC